MNKDAYDEERLQCSAVEGIRKKSDRSRSTSILLIDERNGNAMTCEEQLVDNLNNAPLWSTGAHG